MAGGGAVIALALLCGHALAAIAFAMLALDQWRRPARDWPAGAVVAALAASALWALAIAGIDAADLVTRLAESIRTLAWLLVMYLIARRARPAGYAVIAVYAMVAAMAVFAALVSAIETLPLDAVALAALDGTRIGFRLMTAAGALVLIHHLDGSAGEAGRGRIRPLVIALALLFGLDLLLGIAVAARLPVADGLRALRGFALVGVAAVLAIGARRGQAWNFTLSRTVTMRSLSIVAVLLYAGATVLLTSLAGEVGAGRARIAQTAIVFGSTAALMTLLSTPWLRAWLKVKVAKHLFSHRYDYRAEWQRFTATLGSPGAGADPLDRRIVKALADLTDSPGGLLLVPGGAGLERDAGWNWDDGADDDAPLALDVVASGRIVDIDAVRRGDAPDHERRGVPAWLLARTEAWTIVPLLHGAALVGAIVLARPPVDRALDWEDFDLLRVAGRQAASYLAEQRAHRALADAARFDEFNRRFAFILHDIKNLVSGLTLVARNAERHAENPEFRADMVATLKDSADRMNALLARLSHHHQAAAESVQPVDLAALCARVAARRRVQHPVVVRGAGVALAQPGRLEQLIGHLAQNAIEASAPGVAVELAITAAGDQVSVEVIDAGAGMSAAFVRDQLFRPFVSTKPGGFGIGAYEAMQLATVMDGSLTVASREGEGTRFRLLLPAAPALEAAA